ncbi:hypothetical protein H5410_020942, partial [Solanum commersonii]
IRRSKSGLLNHSTSYPLISSITFLPCHSALLGFVTLGDLQLFCETARSSHLVIRQTCFGDHEAHLSSSLQFVLFLFARLCPCFVPQSMYLKIKDFFKTQVRHFKKDVSNNSAKDST